MSAKPNRPRWQLGSKLAAAAILWPAALASAAISMNPGDAPDRAAPEPAAPVIRLAQATPSTTQSAISPYLEPAPDVFEATGLALWDGKRTLQGIWVAHPLATTARRVRIINTENGRAADGALFKRDTALGGPSVLISSEAAQLLGMEPGASTELRIVAVTPVQRTDPTPATAETTAIDETATPIENETVSEPATEAAKPEPEPSTPEVADIAAEPDPSVIAAAPVPSPRPAEEAEPEPQAAPASPTAATSATVALPTAEDPAPDSQETTFKWESTDTPSAPTAATDPDPEVKTEDVVAAAPAVTTKPEPEQAPAANDKTGPVTAVQSDPEPEPEAKPKPEPQPEPARAEPEPAKPETAAPATSSLRLPYVQAGSFGVQSNATNLVARLKKQGIPALTRSTRGGKLTRVLAGPFQTTAERREAQRKIRALGLKDAVPVRK